MKNTFIMMVGLPGSGKSTYAQCLARSFNTKIISSDAIRQECFGNEEFQGENKAVFEILHARVTGALSHGENVIYDATNIKYKKRMAFLQQIKNIDCFKICYFMATPYETCLKQNKLRERIVPEDVIERMYKNIYIPQKYEGWDEIQIIREDKDLKVNESLFLGKDGKDGLIHISQDNHHHSLTIGQHCFKCADNLVKYFEDKNLEINDVLLQAAYYHDIGKGFTKTFKNMNGEPTLEAHYYQHHLVSAYLSLFYTEEAQMLEIANYIQWHMLPFQIENSKTEKKYIKLLGDEFYENLMILHAADVGAK